MLNLRIFWGRCEIYYHTVVDIIWNSRENIKFMLHETYNSMFPTRAAKAQNLNISTLQAICVGFLAEH
jgi:hypothetical protein